jgi:regulatory protein
MNCNKEKETDEEILIRAKKRTLYLLGGKPYSRAGLLGKLRRSYPPEICETAADWATENGYTDDETFAADTARQLVCIKKIGVKSAVWEMRKLGIEEKDIESALEKYRNTETTEKNLTELLESKYARKLQEENGQRKVIQALIRKGYEYEEIREHIGKYVT